MGGLRVYRRSRATLGLVKTSDAPSPERSGRDVDSGTTTTEQRALSWFRPNALDRSDDHTFDATPGPAPAAADLLPHRPRRSPVRAGIILPLVGIIGLGAGYAAATLLWPLTEVQPTVTAASIPTLTSPASDLAWPTVGDGSVAVGGMEAVSSSSSNIVPMASITKVVTALTVLDRAPLEVGEDGPSYAFTWDDQAEYWNYLYRNESALDVPVEGSLTQYQLLQGALIGSAGNYVDRLVAELWDSEEAFLADAQSLLDAHGITGITIVEATGIDQGNTADTASLVRLGEIAMRDPVIAEIVGTESVTLPGAGLVENTNTLLGEDGVVGIKTGGLTGYYNLLAARTIAVEDEEVTVYASVVGQPTSDDRFAETDRLLDAVAAEVSSPYHLPAETVAGQVTTLWGAEAEILTSEESSLLLWNGESAETTAAIELNDARATGDAVGTLEVAGPIDTDAIPLVLSDDIPGPDGWWRLTHPLQLWGLAD